MNRNRRHHLIIGWSILIGAIIVCFLGLLLPPPHAQEMSKTNSCPEAEVRSIEVDDLDMFNSEYPHSTTTPKIGKIGITPQETLETTSSAAGKAVTVIAF